MSRNQRRNKRNKPGGNRNATRDATRDTTENGSAGAVHHRSSTETKSSLKSTELIAYAGAVLAVIITALAVNEDGQGGNDPFGAESAIRYITYLTIGYLVARGLAKSGSHENRVQQDTDIDDDAAPAGAVRDEEARDSDERVSGERDSDERDSGERDGDERDSDQRVSDDAVEQATVVPSDQGQGPAVDKVDARS